MSRFRTQYNYVPEEGERLSQEIMIDPTGYIPAKRQIENMLYAGAILDQTRLGDYDFRDGEELEYRKEFDVRRPDFDRVDASNMLQQLQTSGQGAAESGSGESPEPGVSPESGDPAGSESN